MLESMLDLEDIKPATFRRLTRAEYEQMAELGMFDDEKVELLRGMVVTMSPQGDRHTRTIIFLNRRLVELTNRTLDIRPGTPLAATDDSEPEPDFTITRHDPAAREHPTTALLVIEVSNSSLRRDRKIKREIYAEAKVPEYWIVDVSKDDDLTVEVYTKPEGSTYTQVEVLRDGDVLRALHAPIVIPVADLPR